jgi:RNA polymerase sigma-70 factor (ECF subfamily)
MAMAAGLDTDGRGLGELSDEQLARRAQAGDDPAFAALADRFGRRLVHFLWGRTRQLADAEDLAQDTLARAYTRLEQYDATRRFSSWLLTIAANLATDNARRQRLRHVEPMDEHHRWASADPGPSQDLARAEWRENLWARAAEVLPAEQYQALWLRYGEDLTVAEVAEVLGRTPVHLRVLLHRARKTLAKSVTADGQPIERDADAASQPAQSDQQRPPT